VSCRCGSSGGIDDCDDVAEFFVIVCYLRGTESQN
jgi:hypothetical protein